MCGVVGLVCSRFRVRLFLFLVAWVFLCWLMLYLIWVRSSCAVIFMALISVCFTVVVTISACFAMYFAVCYNTVGLGDGAIGRCMFGALVFLIRSLWS